MDAINIGMFLSLTKDEQFFYYIVCLRVFAKCIISEQIFSLSFLFNEASNMLTISMFKEELFCLTRCSNNVTHAEMKERFKEGAASVGANLVMNIKPYVTDSMELAKMHLLRKYALSLIN